MINTGNIKMKKLLLLVGLVVFFLPSAVFADNSLDSINQKVCSRFEEDVSKLAAIMEEARDRKNIKETRVAFGGINTPIKSADYQITFAAEAIAYQRAQKYSSKSELKYSLESLRDKVLNAKSKVRQVLDE